MAFNFIKNIKKKKRHETLPKEQSYVGEMIWLKCKEDGQNERSIGIELVGQKDWIWAAADR